MELYEAKEALQQNRCLIGTMFRDTLIADILIIPAGVGITFITAIEELSEQEEDYDILLKDFKDFQLMVTFAHPTRPAILLEDVCQAA